MIGYMGGKYYLASWISEKMRLVEAKPLWYVEVFGGACWVLFKDELLITIFLKCIT